MKPTQNFSIDSGASIASLAKYDLLDPLRHSEGWFVTAWGELAARYGRTLIGAAWNMVIFGTFCIVIITLFGSLQPDLDFEFGPFVVIGFLIFSLLSTVLTDATGVYITNQGWMKGTQLPYGFYIYKGMMRNLFIFGFNLIAAIGILVFYYDFQPDASQLFILAAIPVYIVNGITANIVLGAICVRYRDLVQVVQTFTRFSLFITPIMWTADRDGIRGVFAQWNPLTHFIEIVREPILHGSVPHHSWVIVMGATAGMIVISIPVYILTRRRLVYWL